MDTLVQEVLVGRRGGQPLDPAGTVALGAWMDAQPALAAPTPVDFAAVARGKQLFESPSVGCAVCHSGPQLSDHQLFDVGTGEVAGERFKVPSLIGVGYRAPYLHDGCAATLQDRFTAPCDTGDQHGTIQQLDAGQIGDLIAYLEAL
jgi:cytochrome c peroxidase